MRLSWKLGTVAGIGLYLHPSALLVFLIAGGAMPTPIGTFALVVALFASIVLHELGHALMARRYGIGTEDITLYLFGGVARLRRMPRSAGPELLISLAGPAVNAAIVLALVPAILALDRLGADPTSLVVLASLNAGLGLFNLLPIFPMDGGRVLRALLSGRLGRPRATEIAASIGQLAAVAGGAFALASGRWMLVVLAVFVYFAAGTERARVAAEAGPRRGPGGLIDPPEPPSGFRWADRGDGVLRPVPIFASAPGRGRSWN